jgi:16S rRNA (guanine527-N7)-methyltransferase
VTVLGMRAEECARDPQLREHFDVALSRAAAPSPVLCELALPLLRVGGRLSVLVADAGAEAAACSRAALACGGAEPEAVAPGVLAVRKVRATPERYPRRAGIPGVHPL